MTLNNITHRLIKLNSLKRVSKLIPLHYKNVSVIITKNILGVFRQTDEVE